MPSTVERSAYREPDPAAILAEAAAKLDGICRSVGAVDLEPAEPVGCEPRSPRRARAIARLISEREEVRDHARSLRWRLPSSTWDFELAARLLAEVSQLEWMSHHCVRGLKLAAHESPLHTGTARAS